MCSAWTRRSFGCKQEQGSKVPNDVPAPNCLVTDFQIEVQDKNLVLGLKGELLDSSDKEVVPIAGISLGAQSGAPDTAHAVGAG